MIPLTDFLMPFIIVCLAELGDKTQLAIFCLSLKTSKRFQVLVGSIAAFIVSDGIAVVLGDLVSSVIPIYYIKLLSAALFIILGATLIRGCEEGDIITESKNPLFTSFTVVFLSELGDKTQLASGLLASMYNTYCVFIGVILALSLLACLSVFLGKVLANKVAMRKLMPIAGITLILAGIYIVFT